jgi:tRNA 5-methylaminomethyl-2-thiouridine biosynthesis bifunctional protein
MQRVSNVWRLFDPHGALIVEAPHVVLANAADIHRLLQNPGFTLQHSRGQVSYVPAHTLPQRDHVLLRGTMLLPAIDGQCVLGATYDLNDLDTTTRAESHAENLSHLTRLLPTHTTALDPSTLSGRAGVRCVSVDRLPLLGGAIDRERMHAEAEHVIQSGVVPRIPGLHIATGYASRGIVWNGLLAELLASELEAEPLPLEARLVRALDPARFALRALRQQT